MLWKNEDTKDTKEDWTSSRRCVIDCLCLYSIEFVTLLITKHVIFVMVQI